MLALGADLAAVWHAATTTPRDRKELLRTLIEEVIVKVERDKAAARLTLRWKGGALTEIDLALPRSRPATIRTDEDTIALVRRLAAPDAVIAGILNRQGRATAYGHRFEAGRVGNLRRHWDIPCFEPSAAHAEGELLTIKTAAAVLGVAPSTLHRLLNAGIIPGEQLTPGAPQYRSGLHFHRRGFRRQARSGRRRDFDGRDAAASWTTFSSNGCGARSSMKRCI